jgi:hypothetical protein
MDVKYAICFLLLIQLSGCMGNSAEKPAPEKPDYGIEFKDIDRDDFINLIKSSSWRVLTENNGEIAGSYFNMESDSYDVTQFNMVEVEDTIVGTRIIEINRNDYGYEVVKETSTGTSSVWFIRLSHDTLYYTSPEYPPRTVWTAEKYETLHFEDELRENDHHSLLKNIQCRSEMIPSERDNIIGRWKLMKDLLKDVDYSCHRIIYDFKPDGQLQIISDTEYHPSGNQTYIYTNYPFCPLCLCSECLPNLILGDTTDVYCEVLKRTMIIYALGGDVRHREGEKVLVRIED